MSGSSQDSSGQINDSQVGVSDSLGAFLSTQEEPSIGHIVEYMRKNSGRGVVKPGDGIRSVTSLSQLRKDKISVRTLQKTLNEANDSNLAIDGKFDSGTESELKNFQRSHGITETGKLDLKTAEALARVIGAEDGEDVGYSPVTRSSSVRFKDVVLLLKESPSYVIGEGCGACSEGGSEQLEKDRAIVSALQRALNDVNGAALIVDGNFNDVTKEQVQLFQRRHRLSETGVLDLKTAETISETLVEQRKRTCTRGSTTVLPTMLTYEQGESCDAPKGVTACNCAQEPEVKQEPPIKVAQRMIEEYRDAVGEDGIDVCDKLYQDLRDLFTRNINPPERREMTAKWLDNYRTQQGDLLVAEYLQGQLDMSCQLSVKQSQSHAGVSYITDHSRACEQVREALAGVQGLLIRYSAAANMGSSVDCDMSYQALRTFFTKPDIAGGVGQAKAVGEGLDAYRAKNGDTETVKVLQQRLEDIKTTHLGN